MDLNFGLTSIGTQHMCMNQYLLLNTDFGFDVGCEINLLCSVVYQ